MDEGRFNWQQMGKADYAQCHALVASLPAPIRGKLRYNEIEVLCRVLYLCWRYAQTSGRGKAYCIPSEDYLAKKVWRSVRTVQRALTLLRRLELLTWVRRKGRYNEWMTNLYTMGKSFLAMLYAKSGKKVQQIHHTTKMSHYDLKKGIEAEPDTQAHASLSEILVKKRVQAPALALSQPEQDAWPVEEQELAADERREFLKRQAESLRKRGL